MLFAAVSHNTASTTSAACRLLTAFSPAYRCDHGRFDLPRVSSNRRLHSCSPIYSVSSQVREALQRRPRSHTVRRFRGRSKLHENRNGQNFTTLRPILSPFKRSRSTKALVDSWKGLILVYQAKFLWNSLTEAAKERILCPLPEEQKSSPDALT